MPTFYSHGKLLISGEYLVLQGALALAVPTRLGQKMEVVTTEGEAVVHWKSVDDKNNVWADVTFSKNDLQPFRETVKNIEASVLSSLQKILLQCRKMNPTFLRDKGTTTISNFLEFSRHAGLGSSSTLINNIAQFAGVDAFALNSAIFSGSGYDIACAQSGHPLFYRIDAEGPVFDTVHFLPPQPEQLLLVYLNKKESSLQAIQNFNPEKKPFTEEIEVISEISEALLFCDDFQDFMQLLDEHEEMMQYVLQQEKVKTTLFADFDGVVKSLGAWGGDFVLAASTMPAEKMRNYFAEKGFSNQYAYNELVLS